MSRMRIRRSLSLAAPLLALAACACAEGGDDTSDGAARGFPKAERAVSDLGSNQFATEASRDAAGEADWVMERAAIGPGMSVADIGAGKGYYTVRLAARVGGKGRVLAQDIDPEAIDALATRVQRDRLDNVSVVTGKPDDPGLPKDSFDRIFLVHMYHEVEEPYAFLWHLWPALEKEGRLVVVDRDRPTDRHGIPPRLLFCEMEAVGYKLDEFIEQPQMGGYYASFARKDTVPTPDSINACRLEGVAG